MKFCTLSHQRKRMIVFFGLYLIAYLILFAALEQRTATFSMVMCKWDDVIPFHEWFVIPYFFWFVYLFLSASYFLFFCQNDAETKSFLNCFVSGMSVFLLVSLLYPNGHDLRPVLTKQGLLISMVKFLYSVDTSTNVFPSMHVYLTVAAAVALLRQDELVQIKGFKGSVLVISVLIVLSTVFLKQHSVIDVVGALLLNLIFTCLFYPLFFQMNKGKRMAFDRRR